METALPLTHKLICDQFLHITKLWMPFPKAEQCHWHNANNLIEKQGMLVHTHSVLPGINFHLF